jgi:DNA-binding NtrC family response regulator
MRRKDREFLIEEARKRLQSMFLRFEQIRGAFPWLAPSMTYAEVRRTVSRLRKGAFDSMEPDIPSNELADLLEGAIEKDTLVRSMLKEIDELAALQKLKRRAR